MCGLEPPPVGLLGRQRTPAPSLDDAGDIFQPLGRERRAHRGVARLVPLHAQDRPELLEEAGAVGIDSQGELARKRTGRTVHAVAVPLDLAVPARDDREPFRVSLDAEPVRLRYGPQLLNGALPLRNLSRTRLSEH